MSSILGPAQTAAISSTPRHCRLLAEFMNDAATIEAFFPSLLVG